MKALTLWDPWASLVRDGHKKVETRIWTTKYRGPLAIHAALRRPKFIGQSCETNRIVAALEEVRYDEKSEFPGSVLCIVKLVSIAPCHEVRDQLPPQEILFGNYEDGRYAWFLEMLEVLKRPVPTRGNRMLLSRAGGDETWLAFVPENYTIVPFLDCQHFGCCSREEHKVVGGSIVIGCHA